MVGRIRAFELGLLLSILIGTETASAQIVNTVPLFRDGKERPFSLLVEGSIDRQHGNTNLMVLGLNLAARARYERSEWLLNGNHERSSQNSQLIGNRSFAHLRYRYYLSQRLQWEVFAQIAQDRFRLMTVRSLGGTGPRFIPVEFDPLTWTLATSYLYEVERIEGSVDFPNGLTRKNHRANFMSSTRVDLEGATIQQTFYLQPLLFDASNIRVLHLLEISFNLNKYLSLRCSLEQSLDTIAPSDVVPFDNRFRASLKLDL